MVFLSRVGAIHELPVRDREVFGTAVFCTFVPKQKYQKFSTHVSDTPLCSVASATSRGGSFWVLRSICGNLSVIFTNFCGLPCRARLWSWNIKCACMSLAWYLIEAQVKCFTTNLGKKDCFVVSTFRLVRLAPTFLLWQCTAISSTSRSFMLRAGGGLCDKSCNKSTM